MLGKFLAWKKAQGQTAHKKIEVMFIGTAAMEFSGEASSQRLSLPQTLDQAETRLDFSQVSNESRSFFILFTRPSRAQQTLGGPNAVHNK